MNTLYYFQSVPDLTRRVGPTALGKIMFSKKNKRKIIVDGKLYYWSASGNDGWIYLYIMTDTLKSPKLRNKYE
ncbi:MAG: hypothetical protein GY757_46845 [bacterium]|nr:hypothetical protein [bacterium]